MTNTADTANTTKADPLVVERVAVESDRLSLVVRVGAGFPRMTDRSLARRLIAARPLLAHHTCVSGEGRDFGAVVSQTSLPHVLEHVIIDEQVRISPAGSDAAFVGTTEWLDAAQGRARVEVSFADDLVALRALDAALSFVNDMVLSCEVGPSDDEGEDEGEKGQADSR